ncbi:hypothetical protein HG536_0A03520 [Torulaspora globosa]|uniref:t-SNARE coiled-coil homology domain-containing protein n=1 Tax=Torulaspora globosa TaxID=48254 RepID=A0A7G3ZAJ8_9SACH|nr:uncharacterized protein HG536_0A03520 [Torulaspora globosa]QLL30534.1 hypothetical protein HG536_0A03520 [Torulaspora globosa]
MDIRDRSAEFHKSVLVYKKRHNANSRHAEPQSNGIPGKSSEFQLKASGIAHDISSTAQLLSKLAMLAKRKPMFNDNPVEIAELSFLIKRKIYAIEQSLVELSKLQRSRQQQPRDSSSDSQHSKNVMTLLNTKVRNISGAFKDVLEERQQMEINNRDRWGKISRSKDGDRDDEARSDANLSMYNSSNPFMSSVIAETDEKGTQNGGGELAIPKDSQLLLMEEGQMSSNQYLQERNRAVETIESTIQEVGNLFQQLASMVQEQGEVIQRIDANVDDIDMNISGAQRELLKYFDRVKSNRWLAVKIFFIIFVFFVIWVLVN